MGALCGREPERLQSGVGNDLIFVLIEVPARWVSAAG